ncbi:Pilus assembly protein PilE [Luteimonas sp. 9C]|uniref:type IV pilin protein n=1 Tax=Luteimonas sp. 9C TaxID=2653148 RepID=UPI0012F18B71|nr:type IV pilin protein [Luteimonas sp. 9C]VXB45491.1 Pilus assembly protein PilE [Luteimonas sp. 9C]
MTSAFARHTPTARSRFARGFTLIELMVVVAVVAILASIALPSYQDSVRKSRRAQAKADMVELAQRFERFHTVNNTYEGFWAGAFGAANASVASPSTQGATVAYLITSEATPNTFTLTSEPQGNQTQDTRCGTLGMTNTGVKSETGTGSLSDCW